MSGELHFQMDENRVVRITRDIPPREITEMWAWIVEEATGCEGVAACEMLIDGQRFMMPLVGADEERVRSLEPHAKMVAERMGLPVRLRRFRAISVAP